MGCMCCSLSSFISVCLNAFERATVCAVCALLTCCLLITILCVLGIGVGIGFHYCFVTQTVDNMAKAAQITAGASEGRRSNVMRAVENRGTNKLFRARRDVGALPPLDVRDLAPLNVGDLSPVNVTGALLSNNESPNITANTFSSSFNEHYVPLLNVSKLIISNNQSTNITANLSSLSLNEHYLPLLNVSRLIIRL